MLFVRTYPRETQEMVFDGHDRAFGFFRGTRTRGVNDLIVIDELGYLPFSRPINISPMDFEMKAGLA